MDVDNMIYENESYIAHFKDHDTASKWVSVKIKLLEDAGLQVSSMNISIMNNYDKRGVKKNTIGYSAKVVAARGEAITPIYEYDNID